MAINKTNAATFLPFVQALAAGQKVYHKNPTTGKWYVPKGGFTFDQDASLYCIGTPPTDQQWKAALRSRENGSLKVSQRTFKTQADAQSFRFNQYDVVSVFRVA
jgi:hypothetical protein